MITIIDKYKSCVKRLLSTDGVRYVILTGGRGSGKSFIVNNLLLKRLLKDNEEVILMTRYTLAGVRNGLLPSIKMLSADYPSLSLTNTKCEYHRSRIIFDGIKSASPSKLKSIDNLTVFSCDEASDIVDELEFDTIDQSIRAKGKDALTILILNPTSPDHWIFKRFFKTLEYRELKVNNHTFHVPMIRDPHVLHVHTTFLDNLHNLSDSFIGIARRALQDNPVRFANQFLGIWTDYRGSRVFIVEKGDIDRSLPCAIGVDFGFYPDPTAIVRVYLDPRNKIIYAEELVYEYNLSAEMLKKELLRLIEYDIVADTNMKAITEPLKMDGCSIYYKDMRMELMQQLLLLSDFKIITNTQNLYNELITYRYDRNKPLVGIGDHAIDAMRYAAIALIKRQSIN